MESQLNVYEVKLNIGDLKFTTELSIPEDAALKSIGQENFHAVKCSSVRACEQGPSLSRFAFNCLISCLQLHFVESLTLMLKI